MSFSRSGTPAPPFSYPVGTGVFTDVIISNSLITSNVYLGLSNLTTPLANITTLNVSSNATVGNVIVRGTMHGVIAGSNTGSFLNIYSANTVTTTNLVATTTNVGTVNVWQVSNLANLTVSNTVTTTNIVAAGFTSNSTNTVFNYTTMSVPYINCTSLNVTGTATYSTLTATNSLATGSIGFATIAGTGGSNTQITSRNTGVTVNKPCGTITLFSSAILSQASNTFTLTNSYISGSDFVLVNHETGQTPGAYTIATNPAAGSVAITMRNVSGGTLTTGAPVLQFVVIKSTNT